MPSVAVLVGNTEYKSLPKLECCSADVAAMRELLAATEKFETIQVIEDADAGSLKERIRAAAATAKSAAELFFYFTGHGHVVGAEFFICAANFEPTRPNETGLSTGELHTLLRLADADLVVKVVDACNSGTQLVKADVGLTPQNKEGFKNLIQFSSCLASQSSLTGDPLSLFTEKLRNAALSKTEGIVYYTDLVAALRDQFIENDAQIPFFVSQQTGREEFVDDAHKLDRVRQVVAAMETMANGVEGETAPPSNRQTSAEILTAAESRLAKPDLVNEFVADFFESLKKGLSSADFDGLFSLEFSEHVGFVEPTAKRFIVEVLSSQKRTDKFVTAEISRKLRRTNPLLGMTTAAILTGMYDDEQFNESYDLELNCTMAHTQMRITLTPKFSTLQRFVLVVTCAPSLNICYVFEVVTRHMLVDFQQYADEGTKEVERWYKFDWDESTDGAVVKVLAALSAAVHAHIEGSLKRIPTG